jgi:AcrR family transcriptional regulator
MAGQQAGDADSRSLWFNPPDDRESGRRPVTRERVVAEALAVISAEGAQALSMRAIAARLGVVPGALYRHVRSREQLYDLVLDAVLADRFPALAAYGTHAWDGDRDQRFNSGLDTLFRGLQAELGPALVPSAAGLQVDEPQGRGRGQGRTAKAGADWED